MKEKERRTESQQVVILFETDGSGKDQVRIGQGGVTLMVGTHADPPDET